jgi:hypothetical protein
LLTTLEAIQFIAATDVLIAYPDLRHTRRPSHGSHLGSQTWVTINRNLVECHTLTVQ